jgi:hypothetical protein
MLRIVLPTVVSPAVNPVSALNVVGSVGIVDEVVIDVDIYVVMSPSAPPATTTPGSTDHHSDSEG